MRRRPLALLLALVAVCVVVVVLLAGHDPQGPQRLAPGRGATDATRDPLAYEPPRREVFEERAADGLAHVLFAKSPGGALATAQRTARFRPLVEQAARSSGVAPDVLEAIVFLESAGRPDAQASNDLHSAVGLTQILAQTGTGLLGLHVDVPASERVTARLARATDPRRRHALEILRRRVDERFDPARALAGTVRYLRFAKGLVGRDDLAVVSYHMGVGNLQRALSAYGSSDVPYAQLFFDTTPVRHAAAWRILAALGDDSSTYLWRIRAAQTIMALWREDPAALARLQERQVEAPSAERVLRPTDATPRFPDAESLGSKDLRLIDGRGLAVSAGLRRGPPGRRALREDALVLLRLLAAGVREVSGSTPLVVTAATRDVATDAGRDPGFGVEAAPSTHTTGWAFDLSRRYRSGAQAQALQFWLDRLTALDLIAWTREPDHIHVVVGPRAASLPR
jgi:hypothetical protein